MNSPSVEQQDVINTIKEGHNVIVNACAGSGKSTTILTMAEQMPKERFLQLTYNSSLRYEVRDKVRSLKLTNLDVHTYHSLAVFAYDANAHNDTGMRNILYQEMPLRDLFKLDFTILVVDEAQDMTPLYFKLLQKFIKDSKLPFQLLVLGDHRQGLYEFKGADTRFLTLAHKLWKNIPFLKTQSFIHKSLKMSYRITKPICNFVNNVMFGEEYMHACKSGENVYYIKRNSHQSESIICHHILSLLEKGARPDDFFILCGSIRGGRMKRIENALVLHNIPCFVPLFETDKMDERVINGKIGLSTFHSVKGRQRKYVFIMGFDNGYFEFYARNLPHNTCPNTLYVGATRASSHLFLFESDNFSTDRPLEFLQYDHHQLAKSDFCKFLGTPRSIFYEKSELEKREIAVQNTTPSELIKFMHEDVLDIITPILARIYTVTTPKQETFEIPAIVQTGAKLYEEVSDLNGIAIPCMYYDEIQRKWNNDNRSVLFDMILERFITIEKPHAYLKEAVEKVSETMTSITDYLYGANVYKAIDEHYYSKLRQIDVEQCTWLSDEDIEKCKLRIHEVISQDCESNKPNAEFCIIHNSEEEKHQAIDQILDDICPDNLRFRFTARVDLETDNYIYELKCTSELSLEHRVQVVIYAWLYKILGYPEKTFRIFNIKTGEMLTLDASIEDLSMIMRTVIKGKYTNTKRLDDDEFLQSQETQETQETQEM